MVAQSKSDERESNLKGRTFGSERTTQFIWVSKKILILLYHHLKTVWLGPLAKHCFSQRLICSITVPYLFFLKGRTFIWSRQCHMYLLRHCSQKRKAGASDISQEWGRNAAYRHISWNCCLLFLTYKKAEAIKIDVCVYMFDANGKKQIYLCGSIFKFKRMSVKQTEFLLTQKPSLFLNSHSLGSSLAQVHIKFLELWILWTSMHLVLSATMILGSKDSDFKGTLPKNASKNSRF